MKPTKKAELELKKLLDRFIAFDDNLNIRKDQEDEFCKAFGVPKSEIIDQILQWHERHCRGRTEKEKTKIIRKIKSELKKCYIVVDPAKEWEAEEEGYMKEQVDDLLARLAKGKK